MTTVTRYACPGLRSQPLASYLAGLGLVRVLGEQADPAATAAWTQDGLIVTTTVEDIAGWLAVARACFRLDPVSWYTACSAASHPVRPGGA